MRKLCAGSLTRNRVVVILLIALIGLAVRLARLYLTEGYTYYSTIDEMTHYRFAREWSEGKLAAIYLGSRPPDGAFRTPSFVFNLPHGLLYTLDPSPYPMLVFIALLNTLALFACYRIIDLLFPKRPEYSLLTTLMLAVYPFPVNFSVGLWNPHYILPFSSLACLGAVYWVVAQKNSGLVIFSLGLLLLVQAHLVGLVLLPLPFVLYLVFRPPVSRSTLILSTAPWLLAYAAYLVVDGSQGFPNTRQLLAYSPQCFKPEALKVFTDPIFVASSEISRFLSMANFRVNPTSPGFLAASLKLLGAGLKRWMDFHDWALGTFVLGLVLTVLNLVFVVGAYLSTVKLGLSRFTSRPASVIEWLRTNRTDGFIALWLLVPVAVQLLSTKAHSLRYAQVMFPFLFLFQVVYYYRLKRASTAGRVLARCVPVLVFYALYVTLAYSVYTHRLIESSSAFLPTYGNLESAAEIILRDAASLAVKPSVSCADTADPFHCAGLQRLDEYLTVKELAASRVLPEQKYTVIGGEFPSQEGTALRIGEFRRMRVYRTSQDRQ